VLDWGKSLSSFYVFFDLIPLVLFFDLTCLTQHTFCQTGSWRIFVLEKVEVNKFCLLWSRCFTSYSSADPEYNLTLIQTTPRRLRASKVGRSVWSSARASSWCRRRSSARKAVTPTVLSNTRESKPAVDSVSTTECNWRQVIVTLNRFRSIDKSRTRSIEFFFQNAASAEKLKMSWIHYSIWNSARNPMRYSI